jgi:hypothetical protein
VPAERGIAGGYVFGWSEQPESAQLVFQAVGTIHERLQLDFSAGKVQLTSKGELTPIPTLPYLAPFTSILAPIVLGAKDGCSRRVLGIGRAPQHAATSPEARLALTHVQVFTLSSERFGWEDAPDTSGVEAFTVVEHDGNVLVGVIRESSPGTHEFRLLRMSGCNSFESLAALPIDFNWRTPPAPRMGQLEAEMNVDGAMPGYVPRFDYPTILPAKTLTSDTGTRVVFAHYDGYAARVVEAKNEGMSWSLSFRLTSLHEARDDLAFSDATRSLSDTSAP